MNKREMNIGEQIGFKSYLDRKRNYISNLKNSYRLNQIEIYKNLLVLAVAGFGYNLILIEGELLQGWAFFFWGGTAFGLACTVILCFSVFQISSSIESTVIELEEREIELEELGIELEDLEEEYERKNGWLEKSIETQITWLNCFKFLAFATFALSMVTIFLQIIFVNA